MIVQAPPRRQRRTRWAGAVAGLAFVALVAAACTSSTEAPDAATGGSQPPGTFSANETNEDAGPPQSGGVLRYGLSAETDGYDPANSRWGGSGYVVAFAIFDPLAAYGADLEVHPYLASSLDHNADFTQWTIGVRPGVTFHDGTPVDAASIAATLTTNKASQLAGTVFDFAESFIPSADGKTVVVTMNRPWATFPQVITAQTGVIAAPSMANDPEAAKHPVGSGPFIFDSWSSGNELKVTKNPNYWRQGLPYLDGIDFKIISDVQARGSTFDSGAVDIFETSDPNQIMSYSTRAESGDVQIFTDQTGESGKIFMALNLAKPPFDDPIARQAVAYGIDREALSEQAFSGIFPAVDGPFSRNSPFYEADHGYPTFDQAKARELAQQYEAAHGVPLSFSSTVLPTPESQLVGQVVQAQLREVGIEVKVESKEQAAILADTVLGNYEATGFILFGSPSIDREYVFFAGPARPIGQLSLNFTRITDEENAGVREAMDTIRSTDDPEVIKEQYAIVQEQMAKNLNMIFLVQQTSGVVFTASTHGVLRWTLPDASGGPGAEGQPSTVPFTANIWLEQQ